MLAFVQRKRPSRHLCDSHRFGSCSAWAMFHSGNTVSELIMCTISCLTHVSCLQLKPLGVAPAATSAKALRTMGNPFTTFMPRLRRNQAS